MVDAYETSLNDVDTFKLLDGNRLAVKFNGEIEYFIYSSTLKKISPIGFSDFKEGSNGFLTICNKGKWGLIDSMGNVCIRPKFNAAGNYKNGIVALKKGDEWGFADERGRWVISPKFYVGNEDEAPEFFEGLAPVLNKNTGLWEYINAQGGIEISTGFNEAFRFKGGHAWVVKDNNFYLINKKGLVVLGPYIDVATEHPGDCVPVFDNDRIGFVTQKSGLIALEPSFFEVGFWQNGYTSAMGNLGWTLIDSSGNFSRNIFFDGLEPAGANRFIFQTGTSNDVWYGLVSGEGRILIPAQYRYIGPFNGVSSVAKTPLNTMILIDTDGNRLLKNVIINNVLAQCNSYVLIESNDRLCLFNLKNGVEQKAPWLPQKTEVKLVDFK